MLRKFFGIASICTLMGLALAGNFAPAWGQQPTVILAAPGGLGGVASFTGASGTSYVPSAKGQISVASAEDVRAFLAAGFVTIVPGASPSPLALLEFKNTDGTTMTGSASAGKFALSVTAGTSEVLTGEAAQGNTKTDAAIREYTVPNTYVAGQALTVTVNTGYTGSGTVGASTIAVAAYLTSVTGTQGSSLVTTSATAISGATAANYTFNVTGTTLAPGSRLLIKVTLVTIETGGAATLTGTVNSLSIG